MPGDQRKPFWEKPLSNQPSRDGENSTNAVDLFSVACVLSTVRLEDKEAHKDVTRVKKRVQADADGSIYTGSRDPPGQTSAYIPPGDQYVESYRLSTYTQWPNNIPVDPNELASNGFYYTGYKDRVKCFSCGVPVENWIIGDDESDARWHNSDCPMTQQIDNLNVPLHTTKLKRLRRDLFKSQTSLKRNYFSQMDTSCGTEHRQTAYGSLNQGRDEMMVIDSPGRIKLDAAFPRTNDIHHQAPALQIAEIFSPEHEQLIYTLNLATEADRRKTFVKWPAYPAPELGSKLAEEGFFYLGNLDRTQCFSCSGVLRNWAANDDPRTEHGRHFADCRIVLGQEIRNIPLSNRERQMLDDENRHRIAALLGRPPIEPPDPGVEERSFLAQHFPCMNPINPHMENEELRISSFTNTWPAHKLKATSRQIARAGFFYLGSSDKTKCFYCNGGLQNWDENDEPWTEHAKWFPGCEFVLRRKGTKFVRDLAEAHPNLSRPAIRNPVSYAIEYAPRPPTYPAITTNFHVQPTPVLSAVQEKSRTQDELRQLITDSLCKNCFKETADNLAQPCGHMALCSTCCSRRRTCPVCNRKVESLIKVYRT